MHLLQLKKWFTLVKNRVTSIIPAKSQKVNFSAKKCKKAAMRYTHCGCTKHIFKCPHEFGSTIISRCGTGVENTIWVEVFPKR